MISARSFSLVSARRITALLALLLSAFYVTNAWQTLSVGRWHKPGAAIFPIALGALLAVSGLSVLLERRASGDGAMPVIGNMVASALFLFASMWLLSDDPGRSLLRLAIYASAIALSFEWFFVRLLKVQMPGGMFRQWLF